MNILNGDSTKAIFEKSSLKGKTVIWREMLCEGPVSRDLAADEFWEMRRAFFNATFATNKASYEAKTLSEFEKIREFQQAGEVILWFEYDLFCQINLVALCAFLYTNWNGKVTISLICTGDEKGEESLSGLGELEANAYPGLFKNRTKLEKEDLHFASQVWELYCASDLLALEQFINTQSNIKFKYLNRAFKAHFRRFPSAKNGLNEIEQQIVKWIETGKYTKQQVVGKLLHWQVWYGFGDLQYFKYLENLALLYDEQDGIVSLNETGRKIKNGIIPLQTTEKTDTILGGVYKRDFVFDTKTNALSKVPG